ncbi:extracellular solute-binding protein [Frigoribacterium sp. CFBP 13605]|jgi:cellobiose transport system substrate-binding protein|uniref:ABC transporter substrate-binding protein n=1 Tax=unclassified Frigoribacterium TaxID=2627005 RepID=UPI0006F9E882|nr:MULTISPECIES: extracellular solute-binding protein [unclassified Frigoribacterium]KQM25867.1 sugar ABC transporter substrate-binding protein [Frigoribacterium sp. Leaf8]MBD8141335.1 extracellular solute-binding protein [Frigoribacterium sp. CFBP 13605]
MALPTRRLVGKIAGTVAVLALVTPLLASCAGSGGGANASGETDVWIWPDGLSDKVLSSVDETTPIKVSTIGGDFKQKLVTTFTGRTGLPAVSGVKGEDMPYFLSESDLFTDLNDLGAKDIVDQFPAWKLAEATTADGKLIGIPIDIGPTALYYRADVLAAAGLPSEPADVAAATSTWDDYFAFGEKLKAATGASLEVDMGDVFTKSIGQGSARFVNEEGEFTGDGDEIKAAWDRAVEAKEKGLTAGLTDGSPDWAAAITGGSLPTLLGAAWYQADIKSATADTSGDWRVAPMPGGPANIGGSFLTIPEGTDDPEAAFAVIKDILSEQNQIVAYQDKGIFPSATAAYSAPELTAGDEFFGGQSTVEVFAQAAADMPTAYTSPFENQVAAPYMTELQNVQSLGKDPDQAWNDAVSAGEAALKAAE